MASCLKAKGQAKETNNLMLIKIYCRFEVLVHFHVSLKLWEICHAIPHVLWGKSQVFIFFSSVVSPVTGGKMQKCQWNVIKMTTIWTSWSQTFFVTFSNIHKPWFNLIKMAAVWPSWLLKWNGLQQPFIIDYFTIKYKLLNY